MATQPTTTSRELEPDILLTEFAGEAEPAIASKPKRRRLAFPKIKISARVQLGLVFGIGVLAGWLVLGWWLLPVQWNNSTPWQLDPAYQRTYIALVADKLWLTTDVAQAQNDLRGWDNTDLQARLTQMQRETTDPEARKHLATLSDALKMSTPDTSLVSSLFSQQIVIVALLLSLIPILIAVGVLTVPALRRRTELPEPVVVDELAEEAKLEELLGDTQLVEPGVEEKDKDKKEEKKEDEKKEEKPPEDEPSESADSSLGDLSNLFEEEDTSLTALENFCKGLAEVSADQLLSNALDLRRKLREMNTARARKNNPRA